MTTKSLLLIATLALAGIANAKSYTITLSSPTKAGSVRLAAGEYSLKVQDSNAIFTNVQNGKTFTAAGEDGDRRHEVRLDSRGYRFQGRRQLHYVGRTRRISRTKIELAD